MVPDMEVQKPPVTEIKVRMDCNGCVQKIKKALHHISGIDEIHIDFSQQKITIIGWADPEKIIKAIKKTRKRVIICLHKEQSDDQPSEPASEGVALEEGAPESTNQPTEAPQEQPEPENPPPPETKPPPEYSNGMSPSTQPSKPNDLEEDHVIYHYQPDYGYRYDYGPNPQQGYNGQWNDYRGDPNLQQGSNGRCHDYHGDPRFRGVPSRQPQPVYVAHSYNTYKPSPYVTKYAHPRSPQEQPRQGNPPIGEKPLPEYANETSPFTQPSKPKDHEEVHVIYHQPPDYGPQYAYGPNSQQRHNGQGYNGQQNTYPDNPRFREESSQPPQTPVYVTQSYNTHRVTKHERPRSPQEQPPPEIPPCEAKQLPGYANRPKPSTQPSKPKDHEKVHVMYHQPPKCGFQYAHSPNGPNFQQGYNGPLNAYHGDQGSREEPTQPPQPPVYVAQSYNTFKPSPYVTEYADGPNFRQGYNGQWDTHHGDMGFRGEPSQPPQPLYATQSYNTYKPSPYVTDYANPQSPPRYSHYSRPDYYSRDYYSGNNRNETNITSMFSEENPNACTIV